MPLTQLFRQFILRAMLREKTRSAVSIGGIALGVAVMLAIRLANSSVTDTFEAAVDSVSGNASLRIRGRTGRFDESLLRQLAWVRDLGQLSPVIEAYAMVAEEPSNPGEQDEFARGETLQVLGVDVLLDFPLRDYHVLATSTDTQRSARQVLQLLRDSHSVILTEKFLRRRGLRVGDQISLAFGSRAETYTIRGVLLNRGPARTLDGNFALMDIAAAQLAAERLGLIDHVDVMLEDGREPSDVLPQIRERLPEALVVEFPDAAAQRADTMVAAFQFNLAALSAVALLVGLFLIYNTIAMSVAARRVEIGMLQAAGASQRMILTLFLGEALLLAILGILIGIPAGRALALFAVRSSAQTIETFYIAGVAESSAAALQIGAVDVALTFLMVLPLAAFAAVLPAREAARVPPIEAVRGHVASGDRLRLRRTAVAACVCCSAGVALTFGDPVAGMPVFGFLAELTFMLAGACLAPILLRSVCGLELGGATAWLPAMRVERTLAAGNLLGSLPRVSVSIAALAVSLSMMIAIAVMVGSFRTTVIYWLDSALSSELSVKPVAQSSSVSEARLSPQAVDTIRQDDDVRETVWFSSRQLPYRGRLIRVSITEVDKTMGHGRLLFKDPVVPLPSDVAGSRDRVLVSESFAVRFGVGQGEAFRLPTAAGSTRFHVAGVYYDYASNQGTVMMDTETYRQHYSGSDPAIGPQHLALYLRPEADPESVRRRLLDALGPDERIYCVTNDQVRREAMRIFESTFTITYALQVIAILVAGLGVASTLITLIYQRQREIGLLSLVGATARQIRRVIVIEAVVLGALSQLLGIGIGLVLAWVLIHVINVQSFGWTIQFQVPGTFLIQSTLLVLLASAMFGLYPAVRAAGLDALQTVREE